MIKTDFHQIWNRARSKFIFSLHFLASCLITTLSFGQGSSLLGTVVDDSGLGLPGVTIRVEGTGRGTTTDIDGVFTIDNLNPEDQLTFSFIGMVTETISVGNRTSLEVIMESDITALSEIIVVGYGTMEKKDVTGSVALIGEEEMKFRPNTQVGSLIQGKAAGVQVLSSSGKPSQGINIRIRGTNSISSGSEPLYVVDGVPTTDTRSINPSDVESLTVLKDASSAAIYGSQASNGVVLITTKMGKTEKTTISFDSYVGFSEVWNTLPVLDSRDYRIFMTEIGQSTDWDLYTEDTNWQDEVFQRGFSQNHQLAISGKSSKTNYYLSGGWMEQNGSVRSARMDRSNFKINLDHDASDWLKIGTRLAYTVYKDVDVPDNLSVNQGGVLLGALTTPPIIGVYNDDGTFTTNPFQSWENPVASTDGTTRGYENQRLIGNTYAEFSFLEDFVFKTSFGLDVNNGIFSSFLDPYLTQFGRSLSGQGIQNIDQNRYITFDNILTYTKQVNKSSIEAKLGTVIQAWDWSSSAITTQNFPANTVQTVNGGSDITNATGFKSQKRNQSLVSRLNYDFDGRYLLTANLRVDGSSSFSDGFRRGYFPSFSTGWRISEESFFSGIDQVSELKVRVGWGIVGNDQTEDVYASQPRVGRGANYPIGGVQPGTFPASLGNSILRWEESQQINIGVDMGLYNNRIGLTVDLYSKESYGLLLEVPIPRATGFETAVQNIGSIVNKGLEVGINTVNVDEEVYWSTNVNFSLNRNEVTKLSDEGSDILDGEIAGRGTASIVREGLPIAMLYGYQFGGVDPETGDAFYINQAGESTFDPLPEDRKIIGDPNPDFLYGVTNTLTYKGLSMTVFFQGSYGQDILNATRINLEGMIDQKNQSTAILERWREEGDITNIPRASFGNINNSRISTRFVEDGSYLRLKNLTIGYSLPNKLTSPIGIENLRFYVTGENLLTFTSYSGFDPEVNAFGDSNISQGIDFGTYPQSRSFIAGLTLSF